MQKKKYLPENERLCRHGLQWRIYWLLLRDVQDVEKALSMRSWRKECIVNQDPGGRDSPGCPPGADSDGRHPHPQPAESVGVAASSTDSRVGEA